MPSTTPAITSMTTSKDKKHITYLDHITLHEDSKLLNKVHNYVVDNFKVSMSNALLVNDRTNMLDNVIALKVNAILVKSPMEDEMTLIHQLSKVGGDLLYPKVEYFGLSGFGEKAIPIRFCPKSILMIKVTARYTVTTKSAWTLDYLE